MGFSRLSDIVYPLMGFPIGKNNNYTFILKNNLALIYFSVHGFSNNWIH